MSGKNLTFVLILTSYLAYSAIYIHRTSFTFEGERYFCLFDDAMISMRYAKNLAEGHGLVWNVDGERVEGFTNPLWTLLMAAVHLFPVAPSKISLVIQIIGLLLSTVSLVFLKRVAAIISNGNSVVTHIAVALIAFYPPLHYWNLQGMEVSALMLLTSVVLWLVLSAPENQPPSPWIYILMGVGTLVRTDASVFYVAILAFLAMTRTSVRWRHVLAGSCILLVFLGGQTLARYLYYGEVLPNTYYLKVSEHPLGLRLLQGSVLFVDFAKGVWPVISVAVIYVLLRRDAVSMLLVFVFAAQVCYSIYVGGDAWERWGGVNRYVSMFMPCMLILFSCGIVSAGAFLKRRYSSLAVRRTISITTAVLVAGVFVRFVAVYHPGGYADWFSFLQSFADAETRRELIGFEKSRWDEIADWLILNPTVESVGNKKRLEIAQFVRSVTTAEARIAVIAAGTTSYFLDRYMIDLLGKNDKVVARGPMRPSPRERDKLLFVPGHSKWNYRHSIGVLRPDVTQVWYSSEEAEPYLKSMYTEVKVGENTFYLKTSSPFIAWDRVRQWQ
jgi:arabinofuranosyltransferase